MKHKRKLKLTIPYILLIICSHFMSKFANKVSTLLISTIFFPTFIDKVIPNLTDVDSLFVNCE